MSEKCPCCGADFVPSEYGDIASRSYACGTIEWPDNQTEQSDRRKIAVLTAERDAALLLLSKAVELLRSQPTPRDIVDVYDGTHSWLIECDMIIEKSDPLI